MYYFSSLLQAENIREKTYNNQKVYVVNQALMVLPGEDSNVAQIEERIFQLIKENAENDTAIKRAQSELKSLSSTMAIAEARELLAQVIY